MESDHDILCAARLDLVAAIQTLLRSDLMDERDFEACKIKAVSALAHLDELIRLAPAVRADRAARTQR